MSRIRSQSRPLRVIHDRMRTPRLVLRRAEEGDLPDYCERIYACPQVMAFLPGAEIIDFEEALPRARGNLIGHWIEHGFGPWLLETVNDRRVIGHCGLRYWPGSRDVELLYALERPAWGNGFAGEAARASVAAAFGQLGLERVIAGVLAGNTASVRLLGGLGMTPFERRDLNGMEVQMFELSAYAV